jgi:hypothetical protein
MTREPADRTIAVAITPVVGGAEVEVHVQATPHNLWLHGTTDGNGYVSWQWSDALGDSTIRVYAAGYEPYLAAVHWKTYTDPEVGVPPLNHQITVGVEVPPLVPFVPPVAEGTESGPLHIERPTIRDEAGHCWQWRGFTDFLLLYRYLTRVDIGPFVDERIALGANVLRVLSMVAWDDLTPRFYPQDWPDYYEQVRDFVQLLGDRGMRVELVVFADCRDEPAVMPDASDRKTHLSRVLEAIAGCWNVCVEIANEPFKNLPGGSAEAIELGLAAKEVTEQIVATGEYDSWPPAPTADYGTTHCDRSEDWPRKCHDLMERCDHSGKTPFIGDEPMGAAEVSEPGRRDANPDNHAWYAAGCQMFGPGATFHCDDGIHSVTPIGPNQAACAKAFFEALQWMPKEAVLWNYRRGDMGSEAGVGLPPLSVMHDDARESRTYAKGYTDANGVGHDWVIQIQTSREHATPRDGWRVVEEPRKGFVYLEKP